MAITGVDIAATHGQMRCQAVLEQVCSSLQRLCRMDTAVGCGQSAVHCVNRARKQPPRRHTIGPSYTQAWLHSAWDTRICAALRCMAHAGSASSVAEGRQGCIEQNRAEQRSGEADADGGDSGNRAQTATNHTMHERRGRGRALHVQREPKRLRDRRSNTRDRGRERSIIHTAGRRIASPHARLTCATLHPLRSARSTPLHQPRLASSTATAAAAALLQPELRSFTFSSSSPRPVLPALAPSLAIPTLPTLVLSSAP